MEILLEHSPAPETFYEDRLIYGGTGAILNEMINLSEAADYTTGKPVKFRGKFQEAEAVNKNKRMYPFGVLDSNVKRLFEALEAGGL